MLSNSVSLDSSIKTIKGIGEVKARAFAGLGVSTVRDLLSYFPARYEDRRACVPVSDTVDGQEVCISAVIAEEPRLSRIRKGMNLVKFRAVDETGSVEITYFNQPWMKDSIHKGEEYVFFGKMQITGRAHSLANPVYEHSEQSSKDTINTENTCSVTGRIVPVYRLCRGLSQKNVSQSIRGALDICSSQLSEAVPKDIRERQQLCAAAYAYENIHFPQSPESLAAARKRLVFEELFLLSCAMGSLRRDRTGPAGRKLGIPDLQEFLSTLPFSPTGAQLRAVRDAMGDLGSGKRMNRLVQGDVGSGKTLVAAALIWIAFRNGLSSAFMAPTEILAQQHAETMKGFLSPFGIPVVCLTGSMKVSEKEQVKRILTGDVPCLAVGTHALFSSGVEYRELGLVITDEQHRFGVAQRSAIIVKGSEPHVLVMSATPIPRTLALMIYGDLDVSVIDELPPGRQKVDTFAVNSSYRKRLNGFIQKQVQEGHQVFIVCPRVEDPEEAEAELTPVSQDLKSAEVYAVELQQLLPGLKISCVHGKMKSSVKEAVMEDFSSGKTDVLVSTTVIEVGVDVPNATLMIIENAERFGLSQLHQLRGRVGRGRSKSWCILVSDAENEEAKARLKILCKTNDGFEIAEEDLRLRGPGEFFGSRQHGLPEMHIADLGANTDVLKTAKEEAERLLQDDPELTAPKHALLKERTGALLQNSSSFN